MNILSKIESRITRHSNFLKNWLWFYTLNGIKNKFRMKAIQGKFRGKRCFIIGNGPSLLKSDLTFLKDEVTFASNRNYLIWKDMGFIPTFFTVEDALVAQNWSEEINDIKGTFKIFPKDLSSSLKIDIGEGFYVNFVRDQKLFPSFSLNLLDKAFWGGTVTVFNLQLAYFLGFTDIYLIGIDHNYNVKGSEGSVKLNSDQLNSDNYIHPSYMEKDKLMYSPNVNRMEVGYLKANEVLSKEQVNVYNATIGGKLEVFERVDYDKLFLKSN